MLLSLVASGIVALDPTYITKNVLRSLPPLPIKHHQLGAIDASYINFAGPTPERNISRQVLRRASTRVHVQSLHAPIRPCRKILRFWLTMLESWARFLCLKEPMGHIRLQSKLS